VLVAVVYPRMSVEDFFTLGENVGRLKICIDNKFQKIEENYILWDAKVNSTECQTLAEARRLLFCIKADVKNGRENFILLSEMFNKARCLWDAIESNCE